MTFGQYIKELREKKGLSLRETAKRANMSHSYLSQLENGHNTNPTREILTNLASVLETDYMELLMQTDMVQNMLEQQVNTMFEHYEEVKSLKNEMRYEENEFELEKIFADETILTYNANPLTKEDKRKIFSIIETLLKEEGE